MPIVTANTTGNMYTVPRTLKLTMGVRW